MSVIEDWGFCPSGEQKHIYYPTCDVCGVRVRIVQYGDPLPENIQKYVLEKTHQKNTYDSYEEYVLDIKVDVLDNQECRPKIL